MMTETSHEPITVGGLTFPQIREKLGELWGLDRPITRAELARALKLSPKFGGQYVQKIERGDVKTKLSGTAEVALLMMLDGAKPPTMGDVIKPGYPRGPVR